MTSGLSAPCRRDRQAAPCDSRAVHREPFDLRALAALEAVIRHGSVSKAATALGLSQPSLSRTLARLRETLGDELLVRSGTRMVPTPKAVRVARAAREAMEQLELAIRGDAFDPSTSTRHFRMAAWDYTQQVLLPPLLQRLRTEAPRVSVEVVPVLDRSPVDALEAGDIEVSVGLHRDLRDGYAKVGMFEDCFLLCARPGHPIWSGPLTPERYAAAAHLLVAPFGATRRGAVDLALQAVGLRRHVAAFVPNFAPAPDLLRETDLIATLPQQLVLRARASLKTAPPPVPLPSFQIEAVWHGRSHADEGHRWLRQQLRAAGETVAPNG